MSTLEATVEELKSLPPAKLEEVAGYIHKLKVSGSRAGRLALERAFACLTPTEADELGRAMKKVAHEKPLSREQALKLLSET